MTAFRIQLLREARGGARNTALDTLSAFNPARVPEPEYPSTMLVRSVKHQGVFRWKKHDVFLSEVLWAERIGLLPLDDRWFTIYFAQLPIASFDSRELRVVAWRKPKDFAVDEAGEGDVDCTPKVRHQIRGRLH